MGIEVGPDQGWPGSAQVLLDLHGVNLFGQEVALGVALVYP